METILSPKHFNSIHFKLTELIWYNRNFKAPKLGENINFDFSEVTSEEELYKLLDTKFNILKELNIVSKILKHRELFKGKVDDTIDIYKADLFERKKEYQTLTTRELYNLLKTTKDSIEEEVLNDLFPLNEVGKDALYFLDLLITQVAQYILEFEDPDKSDLTFIN